MTETANRLTLRKQPNGHASDFDIYIDHSQNPDGTGQTDLKIRFAYNAVNTIALETTPEHNTALAITRWSGLLNDLRVKAPKVGQKVTLQDHHLFDKDKKVVDTTSRDAFMASARDYMLQNAGRAITPRRTPRTMNARAHKFTGLVAT